jgi:hypothetical protein
LDEILNALINAKNSMANLAGKLGTTDRILEKHLLLTPLRSGTPRVDYSKNFI